MTKVGSCRWCRVGRRHNEPEKTKWWAGWKLCFNCAGVCDILVQQLVPVSERKSTVMWPRNSYKENKYKVNSKPLDMGKLSPKPIWINQMEVV